MDLSNGYKFFENIEYYFENNDKSFNKFLELLVPKIKNELMVNKNLLSIFTNPGNSLIKIENFFNKLENAIKTIIDNQIENNSQNNINTNRYFIDENKDFLEKAYKFEINDKLKEYYNKIKEGLEDLFRIASISDCKYFDINGKKLFKGINKLVNVIPNLDIIIIKHMKGDFFNFVLQIN